MLNIIETNKDTIYAIGDIHGEFKAIAHWIKDKSLSDCDLIFCGDFGLGFDSLQKEYSELLRAEKLCEERNIDCYIIRGNHDNPDYYNTDLYKLNLSHFKPLSDYSVIKSPQHTILCLGGAISTDRSYRINEYENEISIMMVRKHCSYEKAKEKVKCYWWEKEPFVYNQDILNEMISSDLKIDTICSHAAPITAYPETNQRTIYWTSQDAELGQDLKREREQLQNLLNFLKENNQPISKWIHGHYHEHHSSEREGVRFNLLDMGRNGRMSGGVGGFFDMIEI